MFDSVKVGSDSEAKQAKVEIAVNAELNNDKEAIPLVRIKGAAVIPLSVTDAESLSRWLDGRDCRIFRTAAVLTHGPSHLRNKKRLDAAIGELVTNGYCAMLTRGIG